MKLMIAAGGTGGHVFPALSVALEWRERHPGDALLWIGTSRSREAELCGANALPLIIVDVTGMRRALSLSALKALGSFGAAIATMHGVIRREAPDALLAFGSYVSAPAIVAARLHGVPYFLHEQNTVPGLVNRVLSGGARCTFLGFELAPRWRVRGRSRLVGTPVRARAETYPAEAYPTSLDRTATTILVCGGSQGALSMDRMLMAAVKRWLADGLQVVWQTGSAGFAETRDAMGKHARLFVFESIPDLYPFYAIAKVVVGRSGASTICEAACFGLPCVLIPLPWSAENHQWWNAGLVESQGWGVRVEQSDSGADAVDKEVRSMVADAVRYERMHCAALEHAPVDAAAAIVEAVHGFAGGAR